MSENQKPEKTTKKIMRAFKRLVVFPVCLFFVLLMMLAWVGTGKREVFNGFLAWLDNSIDWLVDWTSGEEA